MKKLFFILGILFCMIFSSCVTTTVTAISFPKNVRESFVKIEKYVTTQICTEEKQQCLSHMMISTGSGSVIGRYAHGSFVLTAAHVCNTNQPRYSPIKITNIQIQALDLQLKRYNANIILMDKEIDACLLSVIGLSKKPLKIRDNEYLPGHKVYNIAAPVGILNHNLVPLLSGYFLGVEGKRALYSIPAAGGSSGSPIIDENGKLTGMIHSVNILFPMITVSSTLDDLKKFTYEAIQYYHLQNLEEMRRSSSRRRPELGY